MCENKKIVVVDDDHVLRRTLCDFLVSSGYSVEQAAEGHNAIKLIKAERIDLVIMDIFMPDKEGISTIRDIKSDFPDIKIIAISGGGQASGADILQTAQRLGADAALEKPFSMNDLSETIKRLIH